MSRISYPNDDARQNMCANICAGACGKWLAIQGKYLRDMLLHRVFNRIAHKITSNLSNISDFDYKYKIMEDSPLSLRL